VNATSRSIVLIGMMGAGKSSVGRCLHRRTGLALLDIDEIAASTFGASISQIFSEHGEHEFRDAETRALRSVSLSEQAIIVTGGGIVLRKKNIELIRKLGLAVWLDGDEEVLFARASRKTDRPLLQKEEPRIVFSKIFSARNPLYTQIADIRLNTSHLTVEEATTAILSELRKFNRRPGSSNPATTS
jgi:shikimate kinase